MQVLLRILSTLYKFRQFECAVKCCERKPEHVERRQKRRDHTNAPQREVHSAGKLTEAHVKCVHKNFIFREKTGQGRNTRNCNCSNHKCLVGRWHPLIKAAHVADVLRIKVNVLSLIMKFMLYMLHGVNNRPRTEEETSFEKCVG